MNAPDTINEEDAPETEVTHKAATNGKVVVGGAKKVGKRIVEGKRHSSGATASSSVNNLTLEEKRQLQAQNFYDNVKRNRKHRSDLKILQSGLNANLQLVKAIAECTLRASFFTSNLLLLYTQIVYLE